MRSNVLPSRLDRLWRGLWAETAGLPRVIWAYTAALVIAMLGLLWDGGWHASWGRDTFFIAPHNMLYAAVTFALGLTYLILVAGSLRPRDPAFWRLGRLQAQPGIWGIFLGCLMLVAAAPFDEWWHRTFGPDDGTGLWSPPHFAGMSGGLVVTLGILLLLRRAQPRPTGHDGKPPGLRGVTTNDAVTLLVLGFVAFIVGGLTLNFYAIRHWYRTEGTVYPLLTMLTGPMVLALANRISGRAGAATVSVMISFVFVGAVGAILKAAAYPIVVSLPVMGLTSALVLDLFYARFGNDTQWLILAGGLAAVAFYPAEYLWASLLNGAATWNLVAAGRSLAYALAAAPASALAGAWLAERLVKLNAFGGEHSKREGR